MPHIREREVSGHFEMNPVSKLNMKIHQFVLGGPATCFPLLIYDEIDEKYTQIYQKTFLRV